MDKFEYLNKVLAYFNITTDPMSTSLLLSYVFKPNNKWYDSSFYQKYLEISQISDIFNN